MERPRGGHRNAAAPAPLQPNDPTTLIPGLRIVPDFISKEEEEELLAIINNNAWDEDLKRKTQQYGYKFEHASQQVKAYLGPLPDCFARETKRLVERGLYPVMPDQMIVNQYTPGQGINPHIDKTHCFDGIVGSLGLGSTCIMQFRHCEPPYELVDVFFARRMAVILTGESRYNWTHGIAPNTEDVWQGATYRRKTRISMTWRRVIPKEEQKQREKEASSKAASNGGSY